MLRVLKDIQHPMEMTLLRALARYEQVPREQEAWRYVWIQKQHPDPVAAIRRVVAMGLVEGTKDADCGRLLELAGLKPAADLTSWELPALGESVGMLFRYLTDLIQTHIAQWRAA